MNREERAEYRRKWHDSILKDEYMMEMVNSAIVHSKVYQNLNYEKASEIFKVFAENKRNQNPLIRTDTVVSVLNDDVESAIRLYINKHICVLNYASYTDPGGQFLEGSAAQEEALCEVSGLYEVLSAFTSKYYAPHYKTKNFGKYTHSVLVNLGVPFKLDDRIVKVDVITCAACNLRRTLRYDRNNIELLEDMRLAMIERQELVYLLAACTGCDVFITGPWGCGVFQNDPWDIVNNWDSCIKKYNGLVPRVIMSVPGSMEDRNVELFYRIFNKPKKTKMKRCVTFQSKEVCDIIRYGGTYVPTIDRCREGAGGLAKVWCFDISHLSIKDFNNGEVFERFRCEMSLDQEVGLTQFYMFELLIAEDRLSWSDAHNSYKYALIFDALYPRDVQAIYTVHHTPFWFFKSTKIYKKYVDKPFFGDGIDMFYSGCWAKYIKKVKPNDEDAELERLKLEYGVKDFNDVIERLLDGPLNYIKKDCEDI